MLIAVLHDDVSFDAPPDEQDNLIQASTIKDVLIESGHEVVLLPFCLNLDSTRSRLCEISPDVVFNLVESVGGIGRFIIFGASLFEWLGIPYTGCQADALYITSSKLLTKQVFRNNGIPTPNWATPASIRAGQPILDSVWIIKSVWEHASVGIDDSSLIKTKDADHLLSEIEERLQSLGNSAFAEVFVDGREFNVALYETETGPNILPIAEICFHDYRNDKPKIVGYKAKWNEKSFEFNNTIRRFDFPSEDAPLIEELKSIARKCWEVFGLKGYARVDFRVDLHGKPFVLEVNANPCLSKDAGFAAAIAEAGLAYSDIIENIVTIPLFVKDGVVKRIHGSENVDSLPIAFRDAPTEKDRAAIESIVISTNVFTEAEVGIAVELVDDFLSKGEASEYRFLLCDLEGRLAGYACYGEIPGTVSAFDLYWIAVDPAMHRHHLGTRIIDEAENRVKKLGGTKVYVDTSGRSAYIPTRLFYEARGYIKEAVLKDFYAPFDDKVIYAKEIT